MKRFVMHTIAAACLAAAVGPAFASASSSATLGNLVITLTDLNPTDDISPWLSFNNLSSASLLSETVGYGEFNDGHVSIRYAPSQGGLVSTQTATDWSSSSASVLASSGLGGFTTLSAQGHAGSGLDGYGSYRANASAASSPFSAFTLSANTKVTFSVVADLKAQTTMGYNLEADMAEDAYAVAVLGVWGDVNGIFQIDSKQHDVVAGFDVRDDNTTVGVSDAWNGDIEVSFFNYGAVDATGGFQTFVTAEGFSSVWDGVSPVPEPETYAMLLAGLALVGVARRRQA